MKVNDPLTGSYSWSLVLYLLMLIVLSLWPFDLFSPGEKNHVRWNRTSSGIEFMQKGQIISLSSTENLYNRLVAGSGLSLEVWVAAQNNVHSRPGRPARIVAYSLNSSFQNFALGQDRKKLVMRLRTTETDLDGVHPQMEVDEVFGSRDLQHIIVTYDFFKQSVYINGIKRFQKQIPGGRFSNWDPSYHLVFGNEANGDRPWLGKIYLAAIYGRELDKHEIRQNYLAGWSAKKHSGKPVNRVFNGLVAQYLFNERLGDKVRDSNGTQDPLDLYIPPVIRTQRPFLAFPRNSFSQITNHPVDIILNILAFIPLGFLLHAALINRYGSSLKTAVLVCIVGILFSLCVESLQHFSQTRHSSLLDVVNNTFGMALGVATDKFYLRYLRTRLAH